MRLAAICAAILTLAAAAPLRRKPDITITRISTALTVGGAWQAQSDIGNRN